MYPRDTIDVYADVNSSGNTRLVSTSTKTILGINIVSDSGTPIGTVFCGNVEIYDQKGQVGIPADIQYNYVCPSAIYVNKSASGGHFSVYLHYVPRDRTSVLDPQETVSSFTASTSVVVSSSTSSPMYVQDVGNVSFELAIIVFCLFLMVVGFIANSIIPKKTWR